MNNYLQRITKISKFLLDNPSFCKLLTLNFPIQNQHHDKENAICCYPASGLDFTPFDQNIILPLEGGDRRVNIFIYIDKDYNFEPDNQSGFFSLRYPHVRATGYSGVKGRYFIFNCLLCLVEDKACIFVKSDIKTFEKYLFEKKVAFDLICFVPPGVPHEERPKILVSKCKFFLGEYNIETYQNFKFEDVKPQLTYSIGGGDGSHSYPLRRVVSSPLTEMMRITKQDRIEALKRMGNKGEVVMEIPAAALQKLENRLLEIKNLTIEEALNDLSMHLEKRENTYIIREMW